MRSEGPTGPPGAAAAVALALGSNLGPALEHLRAGLRALSRAGLRVDAASSVWRSAPVGFADQPDFLNAAVTGRWTGTPEALLALAHEVERAAGRVRSFSHAPRTLDVDLIFVGDLVRSAPPPVLPHPRWDERAFVLGPLAEVAPGWRDPVGGSTVHEIWSSRSAALPPARIVAPPSALWSAAP